MKLKLYVAATAFALLAMGGAASANTVVINSTLDLSTAQYDPSFFTASWAGFGSFGSGGFPFTLTPGDTLDWTIQFEPSQSITLVNPGFFWAYSYADTSTDFNATGSFAFLDASGNAIATSGVKSDTEGNDHFGQQFVSSDFSSLPSTLTFEGIHYVGTLDSFVDPSVTTNSYDSPVLGLDADSAIITAVPEPTIWAMLILGFGAIGWTLRGQRKGAAVTA